MATVIRAKISEKNKYYIDKHRYYELLYLRQNLSGPKLVIYHLI